MDRLVDANATATSDSIATICTRGFDVSLAALDMAWQGRFGEAGAHLIDSFTPCYESLVGLIAGIGPLVLGS